MSLALTPAVRDLLEAWLTHLRGVRGRAPATLEAYRRDVTGFLAFQAAHLGGAPGPAALRDALGPRHPRVDGRRTRARGIGPVAGPRAFVGQILLRLVGRARRLRRHHDPVHARAPPPAPPAAPPDRNRRPRHAFGRCRPGRARLGRRPRSRGRHAPLRFRPADIRGAVARRATCCPSPRRCASGARAARNATSRSCPPRAPRSTATPHSAPMSSRLHAAFPRHSRRTPSAHAPLRA
jgi:hypothetical protein